MRNHAAREIHPLRYWYTIIGMHWFLLARDWLLFLTLPRQGGSLPLFTTLSSQATLPLTHAHSILRPHLAVHRGLSAQMLALLAVRHNYHVAPRGLHAGLSPLQCSGIEQQTTDWLTALGYEPLAA